MNTLLLLSMFTLPVSSQPVAPAPAPAITTPAAVTFKPVKELDKSIFQIYQDKTGTYWFGHDFGEGSGLFRWSGKGDTFHHFTIDTGFPSNAIGKIQEDRHGNLFISTRKGIVKFDGQHYTILTLDESSPADTQVTLGPDIRWFGGGGDDPHVTYYDGTSLRRLKMPTNPDGDAFEAKWSRATYPRRGCPYDVYTIYTDRAGHVWFGTANLGATRFDGKDFARISEQELGFDEKDNRTFGTRSIIEDRDGNFWITVTRHRFDMSHTGRARRSSGGLDYQPAPGLPHKTPGADEDYTYIMSMANDNAGNLWMVTYGASVWRYDGKELTHFPVSVNGQPITLFCIYRDRSDGLWLGSHERGVLKFNGKTFEKFRP